VVENYSPIILWTPCEYTFLCHFRNTIAFAFASSCRQRASTASTDDIFLYLIRAFATFKFLQYFTNIVWPLHVQYRIYVPVQYIENFFMNYRRWGRTRATSLSATKHFFRRRMLYGHAIECCVYIALFLILNLVLCARRTFIDEETRRDSCLWSYVIIWNYMMPIRRLLYHITNTPTTHGAHTDVAREKDEEIAIAIWDTLTHTRAQCLWIASTWTLNTQQAV